MGGYGAVEALFFEDGVGSVFFNGCGCGRSGRGRSETLSLHRQSRGSLSSEQSVSMEQAYLDKIRGLCVAIAGVAVLAKARELGRWANTERY